MSMRRGRGRGGTGNGGGGGGSGPGGPGSAPGSGDSSRRGSWRGGPPGSGSFSGRGGVPGSGHRPSFGEHTGDRSKSFQTDTDISATVRGAERELQRWQPDADPSLPNGSTPSPGAGRPASGASGRNAETFGDLSTPVAAPIPALGGVGGKSVPWDQFEANERLFGAKTDYEEEIYTTKLNRSGADFKKREKEAERLANEIMSKTSSNPHVAEERGHTTANDDQDEESKYSGVIRSANAYVPPGARRAAGQGTASRPSPTPGQTSTANGSSDTHPGPAEPPAVDPAIMSQSGPGPDVSAPAPSAPVSVAAAGRRPSDVPATTNGGEGKAYLLAATVTATSTPGPVSESGTTTLKNVPLPTLSVQPPPGGSKDVKVGGVVDEARQFMQSERERVEAKKQSMAKMERLRTIAQFKDFQQSFKVPLPIPEDILPILTKDEEKQKAIVAKVKNTDSDGKGIASLMSSPDPSGASGGRLPSTSPSSQAAKRMPKMKIPEIPPFKRKVAPAVHVPETAGHNIPLATSPTPSAGSLTSAGASTTAAAAAAKLNPNANAFVFKPNPAATAFKPAGQAAAPVPPAATEQGSSPNALAAKPTGSSPSPVATAAAASTTSPTPPAGPSAVAASAAAAAATAYKNPFFTTGPPKRISANPRDDFNPWKHGPVPQSSAIVPQWPYTGRKSSMSFAGAIPPMHAMGIGGQIPQPPMFGGGGAGGSGAGGDEDGASPHSGVGVGVGVGGGAGGGVGVGGGGGPIQPPPQMMPAGIANYGPYYRYQPGIPPPPMSNALGGMVPGSAMFQGGPAGYAQFQAAQGMQSPAHMPGVGVGVGLGAGVGVGIGGQPHQPNGMPMYFPPPGANGIPPGAGHFIPGQMHFGAGGVGVAGGGGAGVGGVGAGGHGGGHGGPQGMGGRPQGGPGGPQQMGPGPGQIPGAGPQGPGPGPMYYGNMPSAHQTPQMQAARPFSGHPTPQPGFSQLPVPSQPTGTFESASPH